MASIIKLDRPSESLDCSSFEFSNMQANQDALSELASQADRRKGITVDHTSSADRAERERQIEQACEQRLRATIEQQMRDDTTNAIRSLDATTAQIQASNQEWHAAAEKRIVRIALAMAERIVRGQIQSQPDIPLRLVREAIDLAGGNGPMRVALHPDDHKTLQNEVHKTIDPLRRQGPVDVVPDASVSRGGCRVETSHGTIDQTLEAQLDRIRDELDEG